jgi:hypothetical protein
MLMDYSLMFLLPFYYFLSFFINPSSEIIPFLLIVTYNAVDIFLIVT